MECQAGKIRETQAETTGEKLFDPIELARKTESVICRGNSRKYFGFGETPDYGTGVATGYAVGCNLRCVFCWANETRDNIEKAIKFYSPDEVFDELCGVLAKYPKIQRIRISDGEPTIGRDHLFQVIEKCERSTPHEFVLETNGFLLGHDEDYVKELSGFKRIYVRIDLKAGTPEAFSKKTGAIPEVFDLPFQAIRNLMKYRVKFAVASMSADPRFMSPVERVALIVKLGEIDPELVLKLEEEMTVLHPTTRKRLMAKNWDLNHLDYPWYIAGNLRKHFQISYTPISALGCSSLSLKYTRKNIQQLRHGI